MKLSVADIRASRTLEFSENLSTKECLGTPPALTEFNGPVVVAGQAAVSEENIVVTGRVKTGVRMTCGRCLEKFDKDVEGKFQQVFLPTSEMLDIGDEIRETIFINLPPYAACREDCRGICPTCGKNKNIADCDCAAKATDGRWNALKKIKF